MSEQATDEKLAWVRDAAGRRFDDLELCVACDAISITEDRERLAAIASQRFGIETEAVLASPHTLIGTVDQIVDTLQRRRDRYGISYIVHVPESRVLPAASIEAFAPVVERLAGR